MKRLFIFLAIILLSIPPFGRIWVGCQAQNAWTANLSRPNKIDRGLDGRCISLWASHGRYYNQDKHEWQWQRTRLFGTVEDLLSQTFVVPYLIPMLENAGCNVFTPRERDWQREEVLVDNDAPGRNGSVEVFPRQARTDTVTGFRNYQDVYKDGENPWTAGTAMILPATDAAGAVMVKYTPKIKTPGRYAVYVSYPYLSDAVSDVHYTVHHSGIATEFCVNQQMGFGTWVYLGTFYFCNNQQSPDLDCVIVSSVSTNAGHVGTDAIRFGGGMGNILRGNSTSGMPRCLEGSRYYAEWAGTPYEVYCSKNGASDYGDDINARSLMTNWLNRGSIYNPADSDSIPTHNVPIEMTLAVHTDAGYCKDGKSVYGSLAICTTDNVNVDLPYGRKLADGSSRQLSKEYANMLLTNLTEDLNRKFGSWSRRNLLDRNYSETRVPSVQSSIIEVLSHQSFPDMKVALHPVGKFEIARSLYKTLLKRSAQIHNTPYTVEPLTPDAFRVTLEDTATVKLAWRAVEDESEPSAHPTSYNIYTAIDNFDFDNGQNVSSPSVLMHLQPGKHYRFKVTACNRGGESLPTQVLSAYISPKPKAAVMVIDGFERLSAPYIIDNDSLQGFDLLRDEGVQQGIYTGWAGYQNVFTKSTMGSESSSGLGHTDASLQGKFLVGNTQDVAAQHVEAIASEGDYTVVSSSLQAFRECMLILGHYKVIDLAFGLQKDDGQLGLSYKTFTPVSRSLLELYTRKGGSLLVSGEFIGSDMRSSADSLFAANVLKYIYIPADSSYTVDGKVKGDQMVQGFNFYHELNEEHYPCTHPEQITPINGSVRLMSYSDDTAAGIAYDGNYRCVAVGFPLECITEKKQKYKTFKKILNFLNYEDSSKH